jgi:hypothetical protein
MNSNGMDQSSGKKDKGEVKLAVKIFNNQSPDAIEQKRFMREVEVGCRIQYRCLLS